MVAGTWRSGAIEAPGLNFWKLIEYCSLFLIGNGEKGNIKCIWRIYTVALNPGVPSGLGETDLLRSEIGMTVRGLRIGRIVYFFR